jgi:hypothetical protein
MQFSRLTLIFLAVFSVTNVCAQEKPADKAEPPKAEASASDQSAATPSGPPVDEVKMTDSTFESLYFKFTYDLPTGWKVLDDESRKSANKQAMQEDLEQARTAIGVPRKTSAKTPAKTNPQPQPQPQPRGNPVVPERYSLLAASPNGLDSLASPVLPRINIWAHRRLPPLDKPVDHAQLLISGKHNEVIVRPQELNIAGHQFVRVELINAAGNYQARYITAIGDFLIGFDFLTNSEREMAEFSNSIKSVKFE